MPAVGDLGTFIRNHRKARGLTLEELGRLCCVTAQSLSDVERGKTRTLKATTAFRMARALELEDDSYEEFESLLNGTPATVRV